MQVLWREKFQECSKKGVVGATSVETLGVDLRTRTKQLGARRRRRDGKKCDVRLVLVHLEKSDLSEKLHEHWCGGSCRRTGLIPARARRGQAVGHRALQKG